MSYKPFTTKYTWQIIDDIKEYLEETNKDQTTLDTLDLCHLIGEIEELNNRIRELFAEKNKLNNIINSIDKKCKYLLENKEVIINEKTYYKQKCDDIITNFIYEELKESDKE